MVGGVESDDRSPETVFFGRRLEIHAAVAGVFGLCRLNSHCPFPIGRVHARFDLGKDHLGDVRARRLSRTIQSRRFTQVATLQQWDNLADQLRAFTGTLPGSEFVFGTEISDDGTFITVRWRGRDDITANETWKFVDDRIVPRLPC